MTSLDLLFAGFGLLAVVAGMLAVTSGRVVHAGLWLVVALLAVAGCYLVLAAELVALVQVLIYVGAIVVLVLVALMLTRSPIQASGTASVPGMHRVLAAVIAAGTAGLVAVVLWPLAGPAVPRAGIDSTVLAEHLFGVWVWPLELLSVLLLVALVGALAVWRRSATPGAAPGSGAGADRS